jgi:hypothetical protein
VGDHKDAGFLSEIVLQVLASDDGESINTTAIPDNSTCGAHPNPDPSIPLVC